MKYNNKIKNVYVLLISLFLVFFVIEISLRVLKPQPTLSSLKGMIGKYYAPSNFNTFELKKNYRGTMRSMESRNKRVPLNTNKDGLRKTYKAKNAKDTIVILGDSYTFGVYVGDLDTYPSVLSKLLEKKGSSYNVINAGYASGFSTDEQYSWLNKYYINKNLCPKFVILGFFSGNDILAIDKKKWKKKDEYGMPLSVIDDNLEITKNGYLKNKKKSSMTVGTEFIYKVPVFNNLHSFILAGKVFDRILDKIFKRGYDFSSEFFSHYYGIYDENFLKKEKIFFQIIEAMKDKLEKCRSNLIVVNIPINFVIEPNFLKKILPKNTSFNEKESTYHKRLEKKMKERNIHFINITKTMLKDYNLNKDKNFFPANGEVHFNENGNYYVGEKIKDYIKNNIEK